MQIPSHPSRATCEFPRRRKSLFQTTPLLALLAATFCVLVVFLTGKAAEAVKPLRALLIAGGCCHDYAAQKDVLKVGIEARAQVVVDILYSPDTSTKARFEPYEKPDWAKGYDVIIHDECSADVKEMAYVQNILNAHKDIPAVNLHCAMHCYRTGTDDWFKFIGIQSSAHGPQKPIVLTVADKEHPVMKGQPEWTTINEELYNNIKVFPTAHALMKGKQIFPQADGTTKETEYVVAWVNDYGKTRIFSTTIGHNTKTVADSRYLDLITRGLLWSCDKLNPKYLKPTEPHASVDIEKALQPKPKA